MAADLKKIRAANRRALEGWIAGYEQAKALLADLIEEAAECGIVPPLDGLPRAKGQSDRTFARAMALSAMPEIAMTRRVTGAVEGVYRRASPIKKQVMELYFWRGMHYLAVCERLSLEKSSVYRYAKEITDEVAAALGIGV